MLTELTNQNFYYYNQLKSDENTKNENMTIIKNNYLNNNNNNYYYILPFDNQCTNKMDYEERQENEEFLLNSQVIEVQSKLEKRNARERNRVQHVNLEFQRLRKILINKSFGEKVDKKQVENLDDSYDSSNLQLSFTNPNKRISKVKILRYAIQYIRYLQTILMDENSKNKNSFFDSSSLSSSSSSISNVDDLVKQERESYINNSYGEDYIQYTSSQSYANNFQNSFYENQNYSNFNNNTMFYQNYNY